MMDTSRRWLLLSLMLVLSLAGCGRQPSDIPVVGFVDAFEDDTVGQARIGFLQALRDEGFSEQEGSIRLVYRNAQGDIPTLTQIVRYMISQKVDLLATSPSLSTITALQNTRKIPVFMMVAPTPELMQVNDAEGRPPANLFGVGEDLEYIDTSFAIIPELVRPAGEVLRVGLLYNQSEPQSVFAHDRLAALAEQLGVVLVARPVNVTAEVNMVARALVNADIDAFFANPDNTVFGAFETILKACDEAGVPIFTSEAGLVERGAVAAYGADIYRWGYQAGEQAARFLTSGPNAGLEWEMVRERGRIYNPAAARRFGITLPDDFKAIH